MLYQFKTHVEGEQFPAQYYAATTQDNTISKHARRELGKPDKLNVPTIGSKSMALSFTGNHFEVIETIFSY